MALIALADAWLAEMGPKVLNRRTGQFRPIVAERQRVADHLARTLKELGLKRAPAPVANLEDIMDGEVVDAY